MVAVVLSVPSSISLLFKRDDRVRFFPEIDNGKRHVRFSQTHDAINRHDACAFAFKLIGMLRAPAGIQVVEDHDCNWAKHVPYAPPMFCKSTFFLRFTQLWHDRMAVQRSPFYTYVYLLTMHQGNCFNYCQRPNYLFYFNCNIVIK